MYLIRIPTSTQMHLLKNPPNLPSSPSLCFETYSKNTSKNYLPFLFLLRTSIPFKITPLQLLTISPPQQTVFSEASAPIVRISANLRQLAIIKMIHQYMPSPPGQIQLLTSCTHCTTVTSKPAQYPVFSVWC
jgi:hypothetical protein